MERLIHTLKTLKYIDMLQDLLYSYNHSVHRSIKTEPVIVTIENEKKVWHTLYSDHTVEKTRKYKFRISDQVRISKIKRKYEKG